MMQSVVDSISILIRYTTSCLQKLRQYLSMLRQWISWLIRILKMICVDNKRECFSLVVFIFCYFFFCFLFKGYHEYQLYKGVDNVFSTLIGGVFFYMLVQGFQEIDRLKQRLRYAIVVYEQMKYDVLLEMINAANDYIYIGSKEAHELAMKMYLDSEESKKYWTRDRWEKMLTRIDKYHLEKVLREMQHFLRILNEINDDFIQKGNFEFMCCDNFFRRLESEMLTYLSERQDGLVPFFYITSESPQKTHHPLYLLFCGSLGHDHAIIVRLENKLKEYQ